MVLSPAIVFRSAFSIFNLRRDLFFGLYRLVERLREPGAFSQHTSLFSASNREAETEATDGA
jgi:hypothetical protein